LITGSSWGGTGPSLIRLNLSVRVRLCLGVRKALDLKIFANISPRNFPSGGKFRRELIMNVFYVMNMDTVDGCVYYRNLLPALFLQAGEVDTCKLSNKFARKVEENKKTGEKSVYFELGIVKWADVIVLSRFFHAGSRPLIETLLQAAKYYKTSVVYETDDDFFSIPESNPVHEKFNENPEHMEVMKIMMEGADAFTTTTQRLAAALLEVCPGKPVYIIPNSVEINRYVTQHDLFLKPKKKGKLRVGWSGGSTHIKDFESTGARAAVEKLVQERDDLEFVFLGSKNVDEVFKIKHEYLPYVPIDIYPETLKSLDLDVALCPLEDIRFNRAKSAIKGVEYSACKFPTVYSNVPPYSDVIKDEKTGIAVNNTQEDWERAIVRLLEDSKLRTRLANQAFADVFMRFNMEKNYALWHSAYTKVLKRV